MNTENLELQVFKNVAKILALLASANRLRMLQIMLDREISVGQLASEVGLTQSATSQHLSLFMSSGLVVQRKSQQTRLCSVPANRKAMLRRLIKIAEGSESNH